MTLPHQGENPENFEETELNEASIPKGSFGANEETINAEEGISDMSASIPKGS